MIYSLVFTGMCSWLFYNNGYSIFNSIFWLKLASIALAYYFISSNKAQAFYYYYNHGLSPRILWVFTIAFDLVTWAILIKICSLLR